jgi:S-formylglutathione hydrolase FrmB
VLVLAGCGEADSRGARVDHFSFASKAVGHRQKVTLVVPPGSGKHPLLVLLHGKGGDNDDFLYDEFLAAYDKLGARAPVVAFPDGREGSYWHDRDSGDWGRYVAVELPAQVRKRVAIDGRQAIGGISMGGYGAFHLAERYPGRYCAAGGHSPAIWRTGGETAPGAFDDAEDFAAHDIIAGAGRLKAKLWLDAGDRDPFLTGDRSFAAAAGVRLRLSPGGHDRDYWRRQWPRYLRFYVTALSGCA